MTKNSTQRLQKNSKNLKPGYSERLLLLVILALGIVGLAVSYGSKATTESDARASLIDSIGSDGKLKADHIILQLNQRGADEQQVITNTNF